ncbi:RDD family protein [Nocardia huaxiensis]|uniref:RDD family protein n=1 Tax=Nocardia huaxiensis TaxID=2755382 RepID=A0A7D6V6R7_9NOCA|nr:RDD family protein [Nocardia huaxiensis]QLY28972.1 RDD family protein [Nocardia huaxiensis]
MRNSVDYLGAEGDPRFPSPRRLRSLLAGITDLILIFGIVAAALWGLINRSGPDQTPSIFSAYALLLLLAFVQYFLLPSLLGASLGQLMCGLTLIRCTDASRPTLRDIARATLRNSTRAFRIRGIHALAPHLVVVRRRDLRIATASGSSGHTAAYEH